MILATKQFIIQVPKAYFLARQRADPLLLLKLKIFHSLCKKQVLYLSTVKWPFFLVQHKKWRSICLPYFVSLELIGIW